MRFWTCAGPLTIVLACAACAHHAQGPSAHAEFSSDDAALFEDGVDLIEDPGQLEGQWKTDWDRDLDRRIAQADVIAVGTVTTLRADVDLDRRTSRHLVLAVERTLEGKAPSELILVSREGAAGYASIGDHSGDVLNRKLLAFVRYAAGPDDSVIAHFHLSVPSDTVLQRVDQYEAQKRPSQVQIIEHSN
ncbi:MAG: hypothetical protein ACHQ53_02390 [Polyangiales bacterium]